MKAIEESGEGLNQISGERIWSEIKKILDQPFNFEFVDIIYRLKLDSHVGFPAEGFTEDKRNLYRQVSAISVYAQPMTKICVFLDSVDQLELMDNRLKWSKNEFRQASFLIGQKNLILKNEPLFHLKDENEKIEFYKKLQLRLKNAVLNEKIASKGEYEWILQLAILNNENKDIIDIIKSNYYYTV